MKRREFFNKGLLASLGLGAMGTQLGYAKPNVHSKAKTAKNIIFLVSDGMSTGTLNMADLLLRQKEGKRSRWMGYYQSNFAKRGLMDTASSNSMVTDSAAAGSTRVRMGMACTDQGRCPTTYSPLSKLTIQELTGQAPVIPVIM